MSTRSQTRHGQALQDFRISLRLDLATAGHICKLSRSGYRRREQIGTPDYVGPCFLALSWFAFHQQRALDRAEKQVTQARLTDQGGQYG